MLRTANPALNDKAFRNFMAAAGSSQMTLQGAALKSTALLLITIFAAFFTWIPMQRADFQTAAILGGGGMIGGFILALVTVFKREWSPVTAPLYAACEGLFLGAVSALYDLRFPGTHIVLNAVILTFGVLFTLLTMYVFRIIRATESESRFGPCSSADSRPCPASSTSSRSRRVAVRRFVVPSRFRYRRPATVKSVQY